jgi:nitroimidazol reductase NimA-like FMN-containing flavoprotein (pyridoxamine 5'-phosphate oxidase superfamily)
MAGEVPQGVLDYLAGAKTVTLATASPDGVAHAATFMYANDGASIYFWARPSSTTASHIRSNRRVSFAIDEYVADWNKAKGIQGDGQCEPVADADELARAISLLADKFPSPSSSASTANISFFRIRPSQLQFIDNTGGKIELSGDEFGPEFHREQVL